LEEALFLNLLWACVKGGSGVQFEAKGFMHLRGVLLAHTGLEGLKAWSVFEKPTGSRV